MKQIKFALGSFTVLALVLSATVPSLAMKPGAVTNPNGFLNGPHYNLNIHGNDNWTPDPLATEESNSMFVRENGTTNIKMTQSVDGTFAVTDANGLDGTASFNIAPGHYNVFARSLAKPGGSVAINSEGTFTDAVTGNTLIPLGYVNIERSKGKSKALNVNELLYVDVTLCTAVDTLTQECTEETVYTDTWVFDVAELVEYGWDYQNSGLKLLQVRFYPCTLDSADTSLVRCMWENGSPIVPSKTVTSTTAIAF